MYETSLHNADMRVAVLTPEWLVTIDTPDGGVETVLRGLEQDLSLTQGPYDCCSYTNSGGTQRFRCLEGSHAGNEGTSNRLLHRKSLCLFRKTWLCYKACSNRFLGTTSMKSRPSGFRKPLAADPSSSTTRTTLIDTGIETTQTLCTAIR